MRLHLALLGLLASVPAPPVGAQPKQDGPACRTDADCGPAISVCRECDPCGTVWAPVMSQTEIQRVRSMRPRARCAAPRCNPRCSGRWVGNRAICRKGRCLIALGEPRFGGDKADATRRLGCKRDADCTITPHSGCGCPPCGVQVDAPTNRTHAAWEARQQARESCPRPTTCPACTEAVRRFPAQPTCHAGECMLVPPPR